MAEPVGAIAGRPAHNANNGSNFVMRQVYCGGETFTNTTPWRGTEV